MPYHTVAENGFNGTILARAMDFTPVASGSIFDKRQREEDPDTGALFCKNAPCPDDSCCGPAGICGYGPDFCGAGFTSNCNATAMCGIYADPESDGICGMNLFCSWGGWCGTSTVHCIEANEFTPCQQGFGSCEIIRPTTCGENSGTTGGRTIGYYLASNVRDRVCNRIAPDQIATDIYTHLYYSFASVDPNTFHIKPWDDADIPSMKEFTALKSSALQTWIAVGGYTFSDPGPTHTTWSDLCASAQARAAFIQSTKEFMLKYGFQGVDLDWEYPVAEERGGKRADTANFVFLLKEMREAYGTEFGISLTLAPDYWYLRWFDAKAMEPYVDYFGFMAYDLHGFWDADVETLGSIVRGQADVREIYNNTLPLYYAGLDPSKINFGLAWYGRGYTLSRPSKPGKCTNSAGVLSLTEIKNLIKEKNIEPRLNSESMMKELVWDAKTRRSALPSAQRFLRIENSTGS
ncbi:putative oviduct-specific glyco protein [Eutypa lata UCREL1]|uniref:chitinase n=1 Tax=Eutypa lata (strain UCR-EL1) TaxID=1287681 RepID=M7SX61_EUTLA|nr:putative oviduct-specific glyco protein [Eutypa lata UCREL1]